MKRLTDRQSNELLLIVMILLAGICVAAYYLFEY